MIGTRMRTVRSSLGAAAFMLGVAAFSGAAPGVALAQPAAQGADAAQAKFEAAQKKYSAADHAAALGLFREALAISGSPNARLYVARCLRELGQLAEAYKEMRETARDAGERAAKEKRYVDTQRAAETELAQLEAKVARVVVTLPAEAPSGAEVRIGGQPVPSAELGQPIATEPGEVTIDATAPGRAPWSKKVEVAAGAEQKVEVDFRAQGGEGAGDSGTVVGPDEPPGDGAAGLGTVRTAGIVVAGVGVAGIALFAIAGLSAQSRFDTLKEACGEGPCTNPKYNSDIDTGETFTTLANVGLVVGIAGLVGGGAMILLGGPSKSSTATAASAAPRVSVGLSPFGASVRGAF